MTVEPEVAAVLDAVAPPSWARERSDWSEVLLRAKRPEHSARAARRRAGRGSAFGRAHRSSRPRKLAVALAVAAVAAVLTGAAVAIGRQLFGPSPIFTPAPGTPITKYATTTFNGREWSLHTYTGSTGKSCVGLVMGGAREAGCASRDAVPNSAKIRLIGGPGAMGGADGGTWTVAWFYGFVAPEVKRLDLITMSCDTIPLALDRRAFLHVMGQRELRSGGWPYLLVARSQDGHPIATERVNLRTRDETGTETRVVQPPANGCR